VRLKLTIAYDGTGFHGWAAQPGLRTVEGELRAAVARLYGPASEFAVAGRTDRGVHALGNVASVEVGEGGPPAQRAPEALNTVLPDDVAVLAAAEAAPDFNARYAARSRSYRYRIWRSRQRTPFELRRSWWNARPLDEDALAESAHALVGEHDFRAFTPTETQHDVFVRVVKAARWHRRGDALEFEITADAFLHHMVRTLVGTMLQKTPGEIRALLDGAPRTDAGRTAPPWGLYLERVEY
jgi:tRNA pseudouridine38-40 synthase